MKADWRMVVKDCRREKTLRISLVRVPFVPRQFFVRMNPETDVNAKPQGGKDAKGWVASSRNLCVLASLRLCVDPGADGVAQVAGAGVLSGRAGGERAAGGAKGAKTVISEENHGLLPSQASFGVSQKCFGTSQKCFGRPQKCLGRPQKASGKPRKALGKSQRALGRLRRTFGKPQKARGRLRRAEGSVRFGSGFCRAKIRCRKVLSRGNGGATVALSVVKVGSTRLSVFTKQTMALA